MSTQRLALDVSGLTVESIEAVPADSLGSAAYGHGMPELTASCGCGPCSTPCPCASGFLPEGWDLDEV